MRTLLLDHLDDRRARLQRQRVWPQLELQRGQIAHERRIARRRHDRHPFRDVRPHANPMIRMMVRRRHIANGFPRHGLADDAHHRLAEPAIRAILGGLDDEHVVVERDEQHVLIGAVDLIDQIDILRERLHVVARPRQFRGQRRITRRQHEARIEPRGIGHR